MEDKREMTVLLAISLAGKLLPPQLLYAGKTTKYHPVVDFPASWDVWHSPNHWSTEQTMIRYIEVAPYNQVVRESLGLSENHPALASFYVFAAHRSQLVLDALNKCHIKYVYTFVPAGCTGELQPLDITFNDPFKREMKELFTKWYAAIVKKELDQGKDVSTIKPAAPQRSSQFMLVG